MRRRVVLTGMGAITPLGDDVESTWDALVNGRSGIDRISCFDASHLPVQIAAEIRGFDADEVFGRRVARRHDRFGQFSLYAAREAIEDAGLDLGDEERDRAGTVIGTGIGGVIALLANYDTLNEVGPHRVSPFMVPMMMPNAASAVVAIHHKLRGPSVAVVSACATGTHAIGEAAEFIRRGDADVMVCGGSEAAIAELSIAAFDNMGALSSRNDEPQKASRPFDVDRDGFVMGEGAGILVLEALETAQQRGARIYAEVIGYGATADAYHVAAPDEEGDGAARAMQMALDDAEIAPQEVDYINAHGTSTSLNDVVETRAIHRVFGGHADKLAVSSTKSMMGHLMGAAGAVEAIACAKSLKTGWVPPTLNHDTPDPECDLNYVPNEAQQLAPHIALSNSFGFGGHNACILLRRWEDV